MKSLRVMFQNYSRYVITINCTNAFVIKSAKLWVAKNMRCHYLGIRLHHQKVYHLILLEDIRNLM